MSEAQELLGELERRTAALITQSVPEEQALRQTWPDNLAVADLRRLLVGGIYYIPDPADNTRGLCSFVLPGGVADNGDVTFTPPLAGGLPSDRDTVNANCTHWVPNVVTTVDNAGATIPGPPGGGPPLQGYGMDVSLIGRPDGTIVTDFGVGGGRSQPWPISAPNLNAYIRTGAATGLAFVAWRPTAGAQRQVQAADGAPFVARIEVMAEHGMARVAAGMWGAHLDAQITPAQSLLRGV